MASTAPTGDGASAISTGRVYSFTQQRVYVIYRCPYTHQPSHRSGWPSGGQGPGLFATVAADPGLGPGEFVVPWPSSPGVPGPIRACPTTMGQPVTSWAFRTNRRTRHACSVFA